MSSIGQEKAECSLLASGRALLAGETIGLEWSRGSEGSLSYSATEADAADSACLVPRSFEIHTFFISPNTEVIPAVLTCSP